MRDIRDTCTHARAEMTECPGNGYLRCPDCQTLLRCGGCHECDDPDGLSDYIETWFGCEEVEEDEHE